MFLLQSITDHAKMISNNFNKTASISKKITSIALLASLAAILQSAGGFVPIVGLFISPFATAPVIISTILSARYGWIGYLLTTLLLILIQPSEVIIFVFTTGLIGIGIGYAFHLWKRRLSLIIAGSLFLLSGIIMVLFIFQFPLLGPSIHSSASTPFLLALGVFSFLYSWLWVEISILVLKRLKSFSFYEIGR